MAFTDSIFRGAMLVLLDGSDERTAPLRACPQCGNPLLRVFTTAGVRAVAPSMPKHRDVCITKRWKFGLPCPNALGSVAVLDDLIAAART